VFGCGSVGKKYVYVASSSHISSVPFDKETGEEKYDPKRCGGGYQLYTPAQWELESLRKSVEKAFRTTLDTRCLQKCRNEDLLKLLKNALDELGDTNVRS
jgi:hypothetical protein